MKIEKLANVAGYVLSMVGGKWGMLVHGFGEKIQNNRFRKQT